MKNEKGIWKVWKYSQMCSLGNMKWSNGCWLRDNKQENSGTFWWITKDISFHSNKIFYTKRQVTLNFSEWTSNIHTFSMTPLVLVQYFPVKQPNQTWFVKCLVLQKEAYFILWNGPGKWFIWTSNWFRTMSLLGGGIMWKLQKCTNQTKVRYKEQWLKKNAFNPRIKGFYSKWYKVQR